MTAESTEYDGINDIRTHQEHVVFMALYPKRAAPGLRKILEGIVAQAGLNGPAAIPTFQNSFGQSKLPIYGYGDNRLQW